MTSIPNATMGYFQLRGTTDRIGPRGTPSDVKEFVVTKPGEFNIKLNTSQASFRVMNQRNEVVAQGRSGQDIASASAKLAPGAYTVMIDQQYATARGREYSIDVSHRENALVTSAGGVLRGTARQAVGTDSGVQKHSLNVVQGGEFSFNLSVPYTRFAVMDKNGKVVASGDTMTPGKEINDILKKPSFKLEPGQYEVVMALPRNVAGEVPWSLNLVPKTASLPEDKGPKLTDIQRILQERETRVRQWAAEGGAKGK